MATGADTSGFQESAAILPAGWTPGERIVRNAISGFVHDALAPSAMQAVVHEGLAQLRDGVAVLPDVVQPFASRWLDRLQGVADTPAIGSEISHRLLRLVEPMLSRGMEAHHPAEELVDELEDDGA